MNTFKKYNLTGFSTKEQTINETKKVMNALLNCVKDKNNTIENRNLYYSEYLQLAQNLIILSR